MATSAAIFVRSHLNHITVWSVICICCIHRKKNTRVHIVMQHVRIAKFSTLIYWAMIPANRFHVISVAKILHENIIWTGIYCTPVAINHERNKRQHVMCAVNYLAEPTIYVNISGLTLDNQHENVTTNVHIAKNHSTDHHCWSMFQFWYSSILIFLYHLSGNLNLFRFFFLFQHSHTYAYRRKAILLWFMW